jgi:hypothetical protein
MFKQIQGQSAVVKNRGVYRTCDLYEFRGQLFVKFGSGFVRLNANGSSSVDGLSLDLLAYEGPLFQDKFGRLAVQQGDGFKALQAQADGSLLQLESHG